MKRVLMLVVRDEEDIIKANLDYHLAAGVDFVIIADHQCLDRTMDIVRDYEAYLQTDLPGVGLSP